MMNKKWFQKRLKVLFNIWWCSWCIIIQQSYIIVSMLMLIRFLAFWKNFIEESIGKLWRLKFSIKAEPSNKLNKLMSKVLWIKTWTGHYAVWLVEIKTKKPNTWDQMMMFFSKNRIYTPLFPTPYPILELA